MLRPLTKTKYRNKGQPKGCCEDYNDALNTFKTEVLTSLSHLPAADNSGGLTILGCDTSSPHVHVSEIKLPPSFYRRLTRVIAKNEWRPNFLDAAKRAKEWKETLRKLCRLRETEAFLNEVSSGFCFGRFSVWKRNRLLFLLCRLKELRSSIAWLTPSIPRSLRAPTFPSKAGVSIPSERTGNWHA